MVVMVKGRKILKWHADKNITVSNGNRRKFIAHLSSEPGHILFMDKIICVDCFVLHCVIVLFQKVVLKLVL